MEDFYDIKPPKRAFNKNCGLNCTISWIKIISKTFKCILKKNENKIITQVVVFMAQPEQMFIIKQYKISSRSNRSNLI